MPGPVVATEKPSGLKECPRCGLRNRPGAYQCEFCGWDFGVISDDWLGQVSALEQLGKDIDAPEVDEVTASKIESTIVKPSEASVRERPPVEPEISLAEELDLGGTAAAQPVCGAVPSEETVAEAIPDPYVAPASPAKAKAKAEPAVPEEVFEPSAFQIPTAVSAVILVAGLASLVAALALVAGGSLDKAAGWVITIVGSLLAVFGISRLMPTLSKMLPSRQKAPAEGRK